MLVSPLLANIYLHSFGRWWSDRHTGIGQLYRYCDDFVVVCRSRAAAEQVRELVAGFLGRLKLTLHAGKTHVVDLGCDGFDFLGFHFHKRPSRRTGRVVPYAWPSQKAMKTVREKIRQQTERTRLRVDLGELMGTLNRIITGGGPTSPLETPRRSWPISIGSSGFGCGVLNPGGSHRVGSQVIIDAPTAGQNVTRSFTIAGWAADLDSGQGTGIGVVHIWAYPVSGSAPTFLGAAIADWRPDVAAAYGERLGGTGYHLSVKDLRPGTYDLAVFGWSTIRGGFLPARTVRVTVR